jgi:hypothetical protein
MATQSTLETFEAAVAGATNDECVEMTLRLFKEVGHRCHRLAEMVLEVDDRDAVNEAFAFVSVARDLVPLMKFSEPRIEKPSSRIYDAKTKLEKAIKRRGRTTSVPFEEMTADERADHWRREEQERERERAQGDKLLAKVDISTDAVLAAVRELLSIRPSPLKASDVALHICPDAEATDTPGRQRLINRVGMVLKELAVSGQLERLMPADSREGRATCRFKFPEERAA